MSWSHFSVTLLIVFFVFVLVMETREIHKHRHRHHHPPESEEGEQVDGNVCHHDFRISLHNPMVVVQSSFLPHPSHPQLESCTIDVTGQNYLSSKYKISYYFNRLIFHSNDAFIRVKNGRKSQTINRMRGSLIHGKHESSLSVEPHNETLISIELSEGFLFHNNTFEIVFTAYIEKGGTSSCPRDYVDCDFERRCIPRQLKCNGWNNCNNNEDEIKCFSIQVPEPKSITAFSILIRLCILLVIGVILRLICIFCGCCKEGFRLPGQLRDNPESIGSSSSHSVAGSLTGERSFNDTPPPYPGTPVQRIVRALFETKSETPPPSYKQAVRQKNGDTSNNDDVSSKDST